MQNHGDKTGPADGVAMSALPPKADMARHGCDVRFVPMADIPPCRSIVSLVLMELLAAGCLLPHRIPLAGRQQGLRDKNNRIEFCDERGFDPNQMIQVLWVTHSQPSITCA
jgi:hypothetical protein